MAVMYTFCFYYSVRLGTIIVSFSSLIQTVVCLIVAVLWFEADPKKTTEVVEDLLEENDFLFATRVLNFIAKDPYLSSLLSVISFSLHGISCVIAILAAYQCSGCLTIPYIILEFCRLVLITAAHITGMILIKENVQDLGLLIGCTLGGSFLLLYLFYCWFCVIAFRQCLNELKMQSKRPPTPRPFERSNYFNMAFPNQNQNVIPNYYSNLALPTF